MSALASFAPIYQEFFTIHIGINANLPAGCRVPHPFASFAKGWESTDASVSLSQ